MKMVDAIDIITKKPKRKGFVVSFEVRERGMLRGDYFPDVHGGEPGIATLKQAQDFAESFAAKRSEGFDVVNVHVCVADDFSPVDGAVTLNKYPEEAKP